MANPWEEYEAPGATAAAEPWMAYQKTEPGPWTEYKDPLERFAKPPPQGPVEFGAGPKMGDLSGPNQEPQFLGLADPKFIVEPLVSLPRVTGQNFADALDVIAAGALAPTRPDLAQTVMEAPSRAPSTAEKVAAGVVNVAKTVPETFTSPLGVATLGMSALPQVAQRVVSGGFAADMARHVPEAARAAGEASVTGDAEANVEAIGSLLLNAGMTLAAGTHAATPARIQQARVLAREINNARFNPDAPIAAEPMRLDVARSAEGGTRSEGVVARAPWDEYRTRNVERGTRSEEVSAPAEILPETKVETKPAPAENLPGETITGSNERKGSEMPAEPAAPGQPGPAGPLNPPPAEVDPRLDFPGNTTPAPGNTVVVQLRDKNSNPIPGGRRDFASSGDPMVDAQQARARLMQAAAENPNVSLRESYIAATDPSGKAKLQFAETGSGMAWTTPAQLAQARKGMVEPAPSAAAALPAPLKPRRQNLDRPWDIIDDIEAQVGGQLSLTQAREHLETFRPTGAARKLFANRGIHKLDSVLDALHREGLYRGIESEGDLLEAIQKAADVRKAQRKGTPESRMLKVEEKQADAWGKAQENPGKAAETIDTSALIEGDEFTLKGATVRVKKLEFDADGEVLTLELEDGRRFGTQRVSPTEPIKIDQGSLKLKERSTDFVPAEELAKPEPAPKLKPGESAGAFELGDPKISADVLAERKRLEEQRAAIAERQNKRLVGGEVDSTMDMLDATKADNPLFAHKGPGAGGSGRASYPAGGGFANVPPVAGTLPAGAPINPIQFPEMVALAKTLTGDVVGQRRFQKALGMFYGSGPGKIKLHPDLFKAGREDDLAKVLAHEIGHLGDYLPDRTLKRGNLLGRIATLRNHLKNTFGATTVTNKELRAELLAVTQMWHPYNAAQVPASYRKYRESAAELYADAISVLFNSPGTLQQLAPKFYAEFFKFLNRKPEVKQEFFALQDLLNRGFDEVAAKRVDDMRAAFEKAEVTLKERMAEREQARTFTGWFQRFKQEFVDKGEVISRAVDAKGLPAWQSPRNAFEQMFFADNLNYLDVRRIYEKAVQPVLDAGMDLKDLGVLLKLQREVGGVDPTGKPTGTRAEIANPHGMQPKHAADTLREFEAALGPQKAAVLGRAAKAFREIVFERVREGADVGIYNRETFNTTIVGNKEWYAAFRGLDHVDTFVSPLVRQARGTLGEIENPFTTTLLKLTSLNNLIQVQRAKIASRDLFMRDFPDSWKQSETYHTGTERRAKAPAKGLDRMTMLEDGRVVEYDVDPYIAQAFDKLTPAEVSVVTKMFNGLFRGLVYPLIIRYNPGFQYFLNPYRDFKRSARNLGAAAGVNRWTLMRNYVATWKNAKNFVKGRPDPLVDEMLQQAAIGLPVEGFSRLDRQDALSEVLKRYHLLDAPEQSKLKRAFMWLPRHIERAGAVREALPKFAAYKTLVKDRGMAPEEASYIVRNYVGTPNYKVKGQYGNVANVVVPFLNIFIQGYRADFKLATSPTTAGGWWMRWFINDGSKAMLIAMAEVGAFGTAIQQLFNGISEHDKSNYTVIPIGHQVGGEHGSKTVYVRLPRDETSRFLSAVTYKFTRLALGDKEARKFPSEIFAVGGGIVPTTTPILQVADAWHDYLAGQNPIDPWRNQPVIPATEFKAGGWDSLKPMMVYSFSKSGLMNFVAYNKDADTTTELVMSGAPIINRVLKISDYGFREQQLDAERDEDRLKAIQKMNYAPEVRDLLHEYYRLQRLGERRTGQQEERYAYLNVWHRAFRKFDEAAWLSAQDGAATERDALLKEFSTFTQQFRTNALPAKVERFEFEAGTPAR
jgi:hypothetical protein